MVAAVLFHHLYPRISIANDVLLRMRTRHIIPLKRSFSNYSSSGSRPITMATKSENLVETATKETAKEEDKKEKKEDEVSLPPPPEKPEPGDCCGSGCVRCVWDLYYEELEEYNKLLTPKSEENKSN